MALNKYQIFEDVDSIASWLKDGSGNAISSTAGALDVNVASGDLTVDLDHIEDSVRLGDGTNFLTSENVGADYALHTYLLNSSLVVSATDLDTRDLAFSTDSVTAHQGGTWVIDSITNPVTVSATDFDIRDLSHLQDSIKIGDGVEFLAVNADGSINVQSVDLDIRDLSAAQDSVAAYLSDSAGNGISSTTGFLDVYVQNAIETTPAGFASGVYGANSVTNTAGAITAGTAGRDKVLLQNRGNQAIFIGFNASVTTVNGIEIPKGGSYEMEVSDGVTLYGITASGTADLRYQELSA
jgi:hypothetical protein